MHILVVEDEPKLSRYLKRGLEEEGYAVDLAHNGREALEWAITMPFDLMVLDIMLPGMDGIALCRELRERDIRTPILMLTARDTIEDRVKGLDVGADDYLVKPFAFQEFLARLRALGRRSLDAPKTAFLQVGDLTLDTLTHRVERDGILIELAAKEYEILKCLMREKNRVLTRSAIADHVWDYSTFHESNVIDVYIRNLRRKVDDPFPQKLIQTIRGVGYRISEDEKTSLPEQSPVWHTLRFRFAVWISLFLLVVLIGFSVFVYRSLKQSLSNALDDTLRQSASQIAALIEVENGTPQLERGDTTTELEQLEERSITVRVLATNGEVIYAVGTFRQMVSPSEARHKALAGQESFSTIRNPFESDDWVRLYTSPLMEGEAVVGFVETIRTLDPVDDPLERLLILLQIGIPVFVMLAGMGGYWLSARALAPIDKITQTARHISADDLATRLDLPLIDDEVGRLAATFNTMLDRLEAAFHREQQFTSDASHELRTPLASLRTIAEMTLARSRSEADYQQALTDINEEIVRMQRLVEDLLRLARQSAYELHDSELLDLSSLLQDVIDNMTPFADAKGLTLIYHTPDTIMVAGDKGALIRLLMNLVDNAIKYTSSGSIEVVLTKQANKQVQITIKDSGQGISPDHLPRIFDRFYRADPSRSTTGTGLGLPIARTIAQTHGGTIQIESVENQGTTVLLNLPSV